VAPSGGLKPLPPKPLAPRPASPNKPSAEERALLLSELQETAANLTFANISVLLQQARQFLQ
jgi:hypothetical protein